MLTPMTSSLRDSFQLLVLFNCLQKLCNKRIRTSVSGQRPRILIKEKKIKRTEQRNKSNWVYSVVAAADIQIAPWVLGVPQCIAIEEPSGIYQ